MNIIRKGCPSGVNIREIEAKSILLRHKKIDSWFISRYGMNLYRGCAHRCAYCDGRSECYQVDGNFGEDITVKTNAVEVLRRELDPSGRRVKLEPSFIMIGGGVGDGYQPVEQEYQLTRRTLQVLLEYGWPVHVLTKSSLVERDLDILREINQQNRAVVSFSFSSTNDEISAVFEPHVSTPSERLRTLALFKREGIACGMYLLPVVPFITDTQEMIAEALRKASEVGINFVVFGGMTLRNGRQKEHFLRLLKEEYPECLTKYAQIYGWNRWGQAAEEYSNRINLLFGKLSRKYKVATRMPPTLYRDILSGNDLVVVMLEQLDYFLRLEGKRSSFGFAAYEISKLNRPLSSIKSKLREIKGVGETTERIILEILETGNSTYYNDFV